jgi:chromate transporter
VKQHYCEKAVTTDSNENPSSPQGDSRPLWQLFALFAKLGTLGFGGPASHIAFMEEEVVERRKWMSRQHFLDLVGATNLIPGPNSTEMAIHVGFHRGGIAGLVVAGLSFLIPSVFLTTVLAWMYVTYGQAPELQSLFAFVKPVVLGVICVAGWRLVSKAIRGWYTGIIAAVVCVLAIGLVGWQLTLLLAGGLLTVAFGKNRQAEKKTPASDNEGPLVDNTQEDNTQEDDSAADDSNEGEAKDGDSGGSNKSGLLFWPIFWTLWWRDKLAYAVEEKVDLAVATTAAVPPPTLLQLFLFFLKVGSILYGSGYVLIAYLQEDVVERFGWLTNEQLVDAVAVGQLTPGPILSTSAFVGYVVAGSGGDIFNGVAGAVLAAIGIFLPSFILVAVTAPFLQKLRKSKIAARFLDGVNAGSLGLMAAAATQLAEPILWMPNDIPLQLIAATLFAFSIWLQLKYKLNPLWLVVGAILLGVPLQFFVG